MMAGLKRRHRGRLHATRGATSTEERNHFPGVLGDFGVAGLG